MQKKKKGFTLAELLIVVAIIAVLVAISIPIFSSQLKKARIATDQANVRSAKAAAAAEYMTEGETGPVSYIYDGSKAIKITGSSSVSSVIKESGYGKSKGKDNKEEDGKFKTGASGTPENGYVEVTVDDSEGNDQNEQIQAKWVSAVSFSGNLSAASLRQQIEKSGMSTDDVIAFTAAEGTQLDSRTTGNKSLSNLFAGYKNLRVIDLSKATLKAGDMDLFQGVPETVTEIDLPQCTSEYNIRGTWYYKDGSRVGAKYADSGADLTTDSRITPEDTKSKGYTIYRNPPSKNQ